MLESWIKRNLFDCKDIVGIEADLRGKPFWDEPDKETTARRLEELVNEHKNKQTE